jgi:hypothetical protein
MVKELVKERVKWSKGNGVWIGTVRIDGTPYQADGRKKENILKALEAKVRSEVFDRIKSIIESGEYNAHKIEFVSGIINDLGDTLGELLQEAHEYVLSAVEASVPAA